MEKNEIKISFRIAKGKPKHLCVAHGCKNHKKPKNRFCPRHNHRYQRDVNPVKYVFHALRSNARRRNKVFTLTLEEFTLFCEETGYLQKRGKTGKSASIDRIDASRGYEIGNIRILTLSENSIKQHAEDYAAPF